MSPPEAPPPASKRGGRAGKRLGPGTDEKKSTAASDDKAGQVAELNKDAARALTDKIRALATDTWDLVLQAYEQRAWIALGYESWDQYTSIEFESLRLRLPREEQEEVVASLRESGLSVRAIASATGISVGTVHKALPTVQNRTVPERISGLDGKSRPAKQAVIKPSIVTQDERPVKLSVVTTPVAGRAPRRQTAKSKTQRDTYNDPLIVETHYAIAQLDNAILRVEEVANSKDLDSHKDNVAGMLRGHLKSAIGACQNVLRLLGETVP